MSSSEMNPRQVRHYLKSLPTFEARLTARRRLGQDVETIAEYVCTMVEQGKMSPHVQPVDEDKLPVLLSAEELMTYRRLRASKWTKRQRRDLTEKVKREEEAKARANRGPSSHDQQRAEEATIRRSLMAKGAITISEVARRLDVSVQDVRKLHASEALPSAGFVPVQHSRGKPVHLWLPETIIRYLNRPQ